ncbi:MAG: GNAT family N-acetyltransferase [Rhodobacteraceae bacterium]|nr:GNAT family N-acetyltransferase [Paracoccaceae bacterium]TVR48200.1 MAG: GNAT family N-acetyltransferase [Paracoccaceae bacterium]
MSIEIRPVMPSEKPQWAQLWYAYLDFYDTTLPLQVYDATFEALFSDSPYSPTGLLAWADGQAVGLVHFLFHQHCWRPEGICYLQDLFVDDAHRARGIGRKLITAVYDAADLRGVEGVYWLTQDFNADARRLYDRVGEQTPFIKYVRPT